MGNPELQQEKEKEEGEAEEAEMRKIGKELANIRIKLYGTYKLSEFKERAIAEINDILQTSYSEQDYRDRDSILFKNISADWKKYQLGIYEKSRAYAFKIAMDADIGSTVNLFKMIEKHFKQGRLLDYGAGSGNCNIVASGGAYADVQGVITDMAQQRFTRRGLAVDIIPLKVDKLPRISGKFDFVVCSEVLEHIQNPEETMVFLCNLINPKGKLLLTYSFGENPEEVTHLKVHTRNKGRQILKLVRGLGFKMVDRDFKGWCKLLERTDVQ